MCNKNVCHLCGCLSQNVSTDIFSSRYNGCTLGDLFCLLPLPTTALKLCASSIAFLYDGLALRNFSPFKYLWNNSYTLQTLPEQLTAIQLIKKFPVVKKSQCSSPSPQKPTTVPYTENVNSITKFILSLTHTVESWRLKCCTVSQQNPMNSFCDGDKTICYIMAEKFLTRRTVMNCSRKTICYVIILELQLWTGNKYK